MTSETTFNLARRQSVKVEPDLLQEDMMDYIGTPTSSPVTHKSCFALLDKVCPDSPLPQQCNQFEDIKIALQRKNSNRLDHAIAFQGMAPGEAASAMASRERGQLHHAQIQRRMTSNKGRTLW